MNTSRILPVLALASLSGAAHTQEFLAEVQPVYAGIVQRTAQGEVVLIGRDEHWDHGRMLRLDPALGVIKSQDYYTAGGIDVLFRGGLVDGAGSSVLAGSYRATSPGNRQAFLVSYSVNGGVLWDATLAPASGYSWLEDVAEAGPGSVVAVGRYEEGGEEDLLLARVDQGSLSWKSRLDLGGKDIAMSVAATPSGSTIVAGLVDFEPFAMEVLPGGSIAWARRFELEGLQLDTSVAVSENGEILLASIIDYGGGDKHPWCARLTSGGFPIWQYAYRAEYPGFLEEVVATPDGGALLAGLKYSSVQQATLTKLDAQGSVEWQNAYHHGSEVAGVDVSGVHCDPYGRILFGWNFSDSGDVNHGTLVQVHSEGGVLGCEARTSPMPATRVSAPSGFTSQGVFPQTSPFTTDDHHAFPVTLPGTPTVLCGDPCGAPQNFCQTTPNSVGQGAHIRGLGTTSIANNDLVLEVQDLPPNQPGIFIYGSNAVSVSFGSSTLCLGAPVIRLPFVSSGSNGVAQYAFDIDAHPQSQEPITVGSNWFFQFWYRDPQGSTGGFNLSDAMVVTACP